MAKNKGGRPTKMTDDILNKLEQVFSLDGSDEEACEYAGISHQTLYNYQKKNPEFVERKAGLRTRTILKARQRIVDGIDESFANAMTYMSKKRRKEFGPDVDPGIIIFQKPVQINMIAPSDRQQIKGEAIREVVIDDAE